MCVCEHACVCNTVFTQIVAAATINFSLVPVRLLFEGGSYYFPHALNDSVTPVLRSREYLFSHKFMRGYNERDSSEFSLASRSRSSAMRASKYIAHVRAASATPTSAATIQGWLELASTAATIRGRLLFKVRLLFE